MMNFELKFTSSAKDYTLNVDSVAVLDKTRIPSIYLLSKEETITTTDQAAVTRITETLSASPVTPCLETRHALLVQANGSRWLVYGVREAGSAQTSDGTGVPMKVKARMIGGHAFVRLERRQLQANTSVMLAKKVRSALDDHQAQRKKRKRSGPTCVSTQAETHEAIKLTLPPPEPEKQVKSESKRDVVLVKTESLPTAPPTQFLDRQQKERLKKTIVTLLSVRGVVKTSADFREIYQHALQAATFALRHSSFDRQGAGARTRSAKELQVWEDGALGVAQTLVALFLAGRPP